jgi:hypothetical protein
MFESHSQNHSHFSKVFAIFQALAPNRSHRTARTRQVLVWLIVVAAVFAQAPGASAGPITFTTTALTVSSNNVTAGTVTTLTATVTKTAPGPVTTNVTRGQVVFCDATAAHCDGAAVFGTAQMMANGTAQLKLILGVGTYSIKAVFQGFNFTPASPSATQAVTVTANSNYVSGIVIGDTGNTGDYTLTGTVTSFGRATATGTVSFIDISDGNAVIGLAALNAGSLLSTFVEAPDAPLGTDNGVAFVATGDFNNDGIPDLAWVNAQGGSVQVMLGNGDGTFTNAGSSILVADPAQMLAVADVNGDGIPDLIVTNSFGGNSVSVLLGIGDGTFQAPVTYFSGTQPIFVAVGDFNGDGILDLAVVNRGDNSVSILLGVGDGTFGTAVANTVGGAPTGLVVGDFNNDGVLDLAVTNTNDSDVGLLIGVGNGTFAAMTTVALPVNSNPFWLATGDLRKTGVLDLVVPDQSNTQAYVLLGNNNGTFAPAVAYPTGDAGQGLALGDVNGDGILDLVTANTGEDGTVSVLLGVGNGTFSPKTDYTVGNRPLNVVLADLNGDGMLDIADSDGQDQTVTILLQAETQTAIATGVSAPGNGLQVVVGSYPGDVERAASSSASIPLNGSLSTATSSTTLTIVPNPVVVGASTTLTATISPMPGSCPPPGSVSFYDGSTLLGTATVNSSGVATLSINSLPVGFSSLIAEYGGNEAVSGSFSAPVNAHVLPAATAGVTLALSAASVASGTATTLTATVLNGVSPATSGTVAFCDATAAQCEGTAIFGVAGVTGNGTAALKLTFGVGTYSIDAVFAGDNALQGAISSAHPLSVTGAASYASSTTLLATGSAGNYTLTSTVSAFGASALSGNVTFLDTSNGNAAIGAATLNPATLAYGFVPTLGSPLNGLNSPQNVVTGDFNNDGIMDYAVGNDSAQTISVFIGTGNGAFLPAVTYPVALFSIDLKVGDFNGDGKLDLVSTGETDGPSQVSVLLGNGDGTFQPQVAYTAGDGAIGVAVGDFNGDGFLDIATANIGSNNVSILLGKGDGTFQNHREYPTGQNPLFLSVGDFNGDGILDLAVLNAEDQTVGVLLGVGDGTFPTQVTYPVGGGSDPFDSDYVLAADFNKDGKLDLIVANFDDNTVSILLGNGDGTFQPQVIYPTGAGPNDLAIGDFNHDGNLDVAATDNEDTTISILYGNGDGTFQAPVIDNLAGVGPWGIASGDFNGDGLTDLVVTNNGDSTVTMLLGQQSETATQTGESVSGAGAHLVESSYPGDASRSLSVSTTVSLAGSSLLVTTTTNLVAAPSPATAGETVTLTATIAPAPTGAPLGTVNFFNGETLLGMGTVNPSGVATFSTSALPTGTDSLSAVYSGNTTSATSTSAASMETVSPATLAVTTTALVAAPAPAIAGQPVMLTATIAPTPTGASLGSVSFYNGVTLLGMGTVSVSGVAAFTTSSLPVGSDTLKAVYSGNTTSATSTSAALMETVALKVTTTTLVLSPTPPTDGQMESFTATVAPAPTGASLGTVGFLNGATLLGMGTVNSSGVATFTGSGLPAGPVTITAVFSGNATSATSTSATAMVTVAPGFTVVALQTSFIVPQGALITIPLTVPPLGGTFSLPVTMSATGLPPGAVAVFTPPIVTPGATGASVVLTIQLPTTVAFLAPSEQRTPLWRGLALGCSLCVGCVIVLAGRRLPQKTRLALACTGLAAAALVISGCNGGFSSPPITPIGTYVVTITGTNGLLHSSTTVTIHVQ